jgi:hypothetical protein
MAPGEGCTWENVAGKWTCSFTFVLFHVLDHVNSGCLEPESRISSSYDCEAGGMYRRHNANFGTACALGISGRGLRHALAEFDALLLEIVRAGAAFGFRERFSLGHRDRAALLDAVCSSSWSGIHCRQQQYRVHEHTCLLQHFFRPPFPPPPSPIQRTSGSS